MPTTTAEPHPAAARAAAPSADARPAHRTLRQLRRDPFAVGAVLRDRAARAVLLMLVGADLVFFVGHLRATRTEFESSLSFVDVEYGHPESFQGMQWLWCLGLLALLVVRARRPLMLALVPMLAFFLLTDRYSLHERGGAALVAALDLPGLVGLRPQDIGELLVLAAASAVVVPAALVGVWASRGRERLELSQLLAIGGLIVACGVVLDAVHILVIEAPTTGDAFGLVEDGGEMLSASLLVAALLRCWTAAGRERPLARTSMER